MLTVNYITRPFFNDIALELIKELKQKTILNVIIIISTWSIDYMEIEDDSIAGYGKPFILTERVKNKIRLQYRNYLDGANVIFVYEEVKETSLKNTLTWIKLLSANKSILNADLNILENLSLADFYFLIRIRNRKVYYIIHDPVAHTGERRRRMEMIHKIYMKYIDKFLLYSSFSTELFNSTFKQYINRTITLKTPIYHSRKIILNEKSKFSKRQVLFFGRISPYKGVDLFYAAAEQLCKEFNDVCFIIAGKSNMNYSPEFLSNNSNPNIKIINKFIDSMILSELMSDASFCVLPYLDATQSGVVMTCYAYELPVLVSNCPGLLEYCFDQENFSFPTGNLDDLINRIRNLLLNEELLEEYKKKIKSYSDKNVSASNVDKILTSYDSF